tara:strand:+ start:242 stop:1342 length:1101 start_codon:yes stop_codon:yes gene_type:complete
MKPKFIISTGTGWSATTPLWYTLQLDNQYMHTGLRKEGAFLDMIRRSPIQRLMMERADKQRRGMTWTTKNRVWRKKVLADNKQLMEDLKTDPQANTPGGALAAVRRDLFFTQEEIDEWLCFPPTLDKYVNYYERHWENLQKNNCPYKAVGDFSNANCNLDVPFMKELVSRLSETFDVKILMIVRDPIRRLWSENSGRYTPPFTFNFKAQKKALEKLKTQGGVCISDIGINKMPTEEEHEKSFMKRVREQDYWDYMFIIDKWEQVAPLHVIIMEQLWEGDEQEREKQRLSDFLDYDIKKIHENVYCPDKGCHAPQYNGLPDQWTSDKYMLQDELYEKVRPLFPVYQQWVDKYGSLPLYWGKPYNYEV